MVRVSNCPFFLVKIIIIVKYYQKLIKNLVQYIFWGGSYTRTTTN